MAPCAECFKRLNDQGSEGNLRDILNLCMKHFSELFLELERPYLVAALSTKLQTLPESFAFLLYFTREYTKVSVSDSAANSESNC